MRLQQRSAGFGYDPSTEGQRVPGRERAPLERLMLRYECVHEKVSRTAESRDGYSPLAGSSAILAMSELLRARAIRTVTLDCLHLYPQGHPHLRVTWYSNTLSKFTLWCEERSDLVTDTTNGRKFIFDAPGPDTPDYYTRSPEVPE